MGVKFHSSSQCSPLRYKVAQYKQSLIKTETNAFGGNGNTLPQRGNQTDTLKCLSFSFLLSVCISYFNRNPINISYYQRLEIREAQHKKY